MFKNLLMLTAAFGFTATAALAAAPTNVMLPNGAAETSVAKAHGTSGFYHAHAPKSAVIFDSIGAGGYNCCSGWTISGPTSPIGEQIWTAIQITPTKNGAVKQIVAGIGFVTGTNSAELAVYSDASGVPGTMLWSGDVSDLPNFGSTSTTTVMSKVKPKVAFTANTPYWVAVQTDANSASTWDAWNESETTNAPLAQNDGAGWTNFGSNAAGAVTLYGKK
jgi:hypothetical protein